MNSSDKLSAKQERLIALLLTERTADAACFKAKVSASTFWRWMQSDVFVKEYRKVRRGILENTVTKLQGIALQAIDTLERNLSCENPSSEIRSAQIILEQAMRGMEILDVESRVEYLETVLNDTDRGA